MKRILGIAMVLGLVGSLTVMAQEVKPVKTEVIDLGNDVKLEMVLIPAGKFKMGSPGSEKGRNKIETQHEVTLTKQFYMGKYEVTQEQWEAVMGYNPSTSGNKGAKLPVTNVVWKDCQEFIKKLNAKTDGGYLLPTESEWEYSCRAGSTTVYSFGDEITPKDANYEDSKIGRPVAVGSYKPNAFGLYDMHGNVEEWCEDWAAIFPTGAVTDPKGPRAGNARILRGGSFNNDASNARSSNRSYPMPTDRFYFVGFRLARTADSKGSVASSTETKPDPAKLKQMELMKLAIEKEMVLIPSGKFMMGSPASEKGRDKKETQHEVTISKSYYMGKYEVTQEQWEAVMGNNPSKTKGAKLPVTDVSWVDCQEFIKTLNAKTNGGYRLPTEAEWEYSCRAGTTTAYSFGDEITPKDANYKDSKIGKPVAVGSYKPNAFGLYDMHGNVWEWCEELAAMYPAGAVTDPKGPRVGNFRILRGGSFSDYESDARSSFRKYYTPAIGVNFFGLRLARTP